MKKLLFVIIMIFAGGGYFFCAASNEISFMHNISGSLDIQVVDPEGNPVGNPSLLFSSGIFSPAAQTVTANLGSAAERIRLTNPSGTTDTWTLSIAATNGATAVWTNGINSYDFNDPNGGGQMTVNPSMANISGVGETSTANVSKGSIFAFSQGSKDSIDLMSASAGAVKPGQWDLTGVAISQTIPGGQAVGSYSISMTLTAI
ncbi:MAG TPA: hypothetical protein DIT25_03030 [Candidatus Moranbacteria bacterium]|nr:hypothetical protein [Candidatus Moranbacteria bacterium]